MLWRHLCLVRAWSAAGLVSGLMILGAGSAPAQSARAEDSERSNPPADVATGTVDLLAASKSGELNVVARGQGQDRVRIAIRNTTAKRLNVVLPPGLVAASTTAQGRGGGLQSMGLGMVSNRPGSFGQFRNGGSPEGLQSVPVVESPRGPAVTVPAGESLDVTIPAVCLNFGLPTPTPKDTFTLKTVEEYSPDARVHRSLRSLAELGTSQGVAQSVMWRVCNDVSFEEMAQKAHKYLNPQEIALAARFVEALDADSTGGLVKSSQLVDGRLHVHVAGEGALSAEARRLADQLSTYPLLGLPVQVVESGELPEAKAPALFIKVVLTDSKIGETRGRIQISYSDQPDHWTPLGKVAFEEGSSVSVLDGQTFADAIDRAVAQAFVTVRPARRTVGSTTLKVENHLPFTLANIKVRAGNSAGAPTVPFGGIGVGPARWTLLPIQAATGSIERVELNGL